VTPQLNILTQFVYHGNITQTRLSMTQFEIRTESNKINLIFFQISACYFVGITPIIVAASTLALILLHFIQLRSLKAFLRKPGPHSSDYHHRPTHIFWRIVRISHFKQ
jgi:hypothetical protein